MGGHGALSIFLSSFSPIRNPVACPWGQTAFGEYLGSDNETWNAHDACQLVKDYPGPPTDILIDQGKDDNFLSAGQLLPDTFVAACAQANVPVILRMQEGHDHSYYFIASFIGDHIAHHAKYLKA